MKYLFKTRKLLYFIKDIIFDLFLILLGYVIGIQTINAHAETIMDLTDLYEYYESFEYTSNNEKNTYNYKNELDDLEKALNEANIKYVITIQLSKDHNYIDAITVMFYENNVTEIEFGMRVSDKWWGELQPVLYYAQLKPHVINEGNIKQLTDFVRENKNIPKTADILDKWYTPGDTTWSLGIWAQGTITSGRIFYSSNTTVIYTQKNGPEKIKVKDNYITKDEKMIMFKDYMNQNREYMYNVNDLDHIDIIFDLDNIPSDSLIGDNNEYFKFKMKFDIRTVNENKENTSIPFNPPSMNYNIFLEDGSTSYSSTPLSKERKSIYNDYFGKEEYTNQFYSTYDYERSLIMTINVRDINDTYLYFKIDSTLNYEVKLYTREESEDPSKYFNVIDMDNKYAVLFIPKIRIDGNKNAVNSYFVSTGKYQVQERDTYEENYNLYVEPKIVDGTDQYYYFYSPNSDLHVNDSFYYLNLDYFNDSKGYYITYDTRYFSVSLCKTPMSCETIENPNTGEIITPNAPKEIKENKTIADYLKNANEFIESQSDIIFQFSKVFNYFFNSLPISYKNLILTIFTIVLIVIVIKIARS